MISEDLNLVTVLKSSENNSLLLKYDIPIEHLSYEYIKECQNVKELERIITTLRSGKEGYYPDLIKHAEKHLHLLKPNSKVLQTVEPILTRRMLVKDELKELDDDLNQWSKQMQLTEKDLNNGHSVKFNDSLHQPEIRQIIKKSIYNNTNNKKIIIKPNDNGYCDYAAWDKYDADVEISRIDLRDEQEKIKNKQMQKIKRIKEEIFSKQSLIDKVYLTETELKTMANEERKKGNEAFKAENYEEALQFYNNSLNINYSVDGFNNRAMTYIKLKNFSKALEDCNKVLTINETNLKGLLRRGLCLENLDRKLEALNNYEVILKLDPNQKLAINAIRKIRSFLKTDTINIEEVDNNTDTKFVATKNIKNLLKQSEQYKVCYCERAPCSSQHLKPMPHFKSDYCFENKKITTKLHYSSAIIIEELSNNPSKKLQTISKT